MKRLQWFPFFTIYFFKNKTLISYNNNKKKYYYFIFSFIYHIIMKNINTKQFLMFIPFSLTK